MVGEMVKFDVKHCGQPLYFKPFEAVFVHMDFFFFFLKMCI